MSSYEPIYWFMSRYILARPIYWSISNSDCT